MLFKLILAFFHLYFWLVKTSKKKASLKAFLVLVVKGWDLANSHMIQFCDDLKRALHALQI